MIRLCFQVPLTYTSSSKNTRGSPEKIDALLPRTPHFMRNQSFVPKDAEDEVWVFVETVVERPVSTLPSPS